MFQTYQVSIHQWLFYAYAYHCILFQSTFGSQILRDSRSNSSSLSHSLDHNFLLRRRMSFLREILLLH